MAVSPQEKVVTNLESQSENDSRQPTYLKRVKGWMTTNSLKIFIILINIIWPTLEFFYIRPHYKFLVYSFMIKVITIQTQLIGIIIGFTGISVFYFISKTHDTYNSILHSISELIKSLDLFEIKLNDMKHLFSHYYESLAILRLSISSYDTYFNFLINVRKETNDYAQYVYLNLQIMSKIYNSETVSIDRIIKENEETKTLNDNLMNDAGILKIDFLKTFKQNETYSLVFIIIVLASFIISIYLNQIAIMSGLVKYLIISIWLSLFGLVNMITILIMHQNHLNDMRGVRINIETILKDISLQDHRLHGVNEAINNMVKEFNERRGEIYRISQIALY